MTDPILTKAEIADIRLLCSVGGPAGWWKVGRLLVAYDAQSAALKAAREALVGIMDLGGEINPSNYTHEDVRNLNQSFIEAFGLAEAALAQIDALAGGEVGK